MKNFFTIVLSTLSIWAFAQCPSGTITTTFTVTSNCTVAGDLTLDEGVLTVNPGVILTITGKLINDENSNNTAAINGGGTIVIQDKFENKKNGAIVIDGVTMNITNDFDSDADDTDVTFQNGASITADDFNGGKNSQIVMDNATMVLNGDFDNSKDNADLTMSNGSSITAVNFESGKNAQTSLDNSSIMLSGDFDNSKDNADLTMTNGSSVTAAGDFKNGKNSVVTVNDSDLTVDGEFDNSKDGADVLVSNGSGVSVGEDFINGKNSDILMDDSDMDVGGTFDNSKDNGDIIISNGGSIDVVEDFENGKNGTIDIGSTGGGGMTVGGDFDNSEDNGDITIGDDSILEVGEDFENGKNADIIVNDGGGLLIDGDLDNTADNADILIKSGGAANVGGDIDDPNDNFVSEDGDDCSDGCCGSGCAALPVDLISFEANLLDESNVRLAWVTGSEINNEGFEIQCSENGVNFETIGFTEGNGSTTDIQNYEYNHVLKLDKLYYRLKQLDYDGQFEFSKIVMVQKETRFSQYEVTFGPNPYRSGQSFYFNTNSQSEISIAIYNLSGDQLFFTSASDKQAALEQLQNQITNLKKGVYLIQSLQEGNKSLDRLVVQ
ncbi:MAG: T9SS type A sorting domain-containing protein [Cyclobacteriaceae bacterium]